MGWFCTVYHPTIPKLTQYRIKDKHSIKMSKKRLSEEQKNLIALVPTHEITNNLTESAKLVLGNLILLYGMDKAAVNGYVFRDNLTMVEETGVTEKTVIASVRKLVQIGLIATKRGKRKTASEYYLTDKYYEISGEERPVQNYSNEVCYYSNNYSEKIDIMGIIETMQQEINELKKQIEELKTTVNITVKGDNYSKTEVYYSTESDADTEKESYTDKDDKNIKQVHGTLLNDLLYDDWIDIMDDVDRSVEEQEKKEYLQWLNNNNCGNGTSAVQSQKLLNNEYVSMMYDKFDSLLQMHFKAMSTVTASAWNEKIDNFVNGLNRERTRFSEKQWNVIERKIEKWHKQQDDKNNYFNKQKKNVDSTVQSDYNEYQETMVQDSITSIDINEGYGGVADAAETPQPYTEEQYKQVISELCDGWTIQKLVSGGMETTIMKMQTAAERKLNVDGLNYEQLRSDVIDCITTNAVA